MLTSTERINECENYQYIESFDQYPLNGGIEVRSLELNETYQFRVIIATSEYDLLRAGRLRNILGIPGQSFESALLFRDKILMKKCLREAGINVPNFKKIESALDLYSFVQTHGYPVIVKPIDGSGSESTSVLRNREDMLDYLAFGIANNLEVESFVEGDMYHIDGLILNNEVVLNWPSRYVNGCLAFQNDQFLGSYQLEYDNPLTSRLIEFVEKVLGALPTPEITTFHAEVFHTPDDNLVFCEIASRTGGAMVREAIQQGFGFDINQVCVQVQCGLNVNIPDNSTLRNGPKLLSGWLLIPPKVGILKSLPTVPFEDWIIKQKISAKPGQTFDGSSSSVDAVASYLVVGNSEEELNNRINQLATWFNESAVWEKAPECLLK
ncbi:ATP-grasp domain-containing protein [Strepomyces sp. STD 3.1]|nr:ATP-grasp domain-containing protein [Streptomyces sp. STD 3.1]